MNMCKLTIYAFALLSVSMAASGTPTTKEKYDAHGFRYQDAPVTDLAAEDFLLMPWGWTPGNKQAMQDIRDCGFNMAGFVAPEHVGLVQKAGLKCFVDDPNVSTMVENDKLSDTEIAERVKAMTANLKDNSCVYGYYIKDEPHPGLFPNLARWANAVRKADPDATPYINLLPGDGASYMDGYVEGFVNTINPSYISYDRYALMDDGSVGNGLYTNLEAIRKVALKHGIPFWNIVLTNSHFHYAEVTQGGLYLQVYASLAYGCRGISYFTYFSPLIGNYRNAAVDQFLHKTSTWDMLRLLNLQIRQLSPTYLKLKSVNVFHNQDVPDSCSGMDTSRHLAEVSGGNFLVGEFEAPDATPFVMVVNKDIHKSTGFQVKFKEPGVVMMTNPYTGETKPFGGENGWLAPGAGALLSLKK
ncbi:hypothetical protein JW926_00575 [Candidatus Sumerlaeota bacterium]|nr:hypothetical protein [Candidatus Sumerlaeota bacterium]